MESHTVVMIQVLGFLGEPTDKEFTAKLQWNSPNFSLRKTDSKTRQPVEGAEYLVYCAQDNEKVNVVRFKTNSNGVGEITSVNPTQASGEVGKTVVKLKAGVRYYIVETKAPEHYKLNKNKQIAIGGEKYPYEAHIGVNATDGHVDYTSITGATFSTTATGVTYHTVDKVAHDPINIVIDKVDSVREDGTQVGKTSLAGAIFKMEYYQGKTTASGTPTNTWYLKTVKVGNQYKASFSKTCLVTGNKDYPSDAAPDTLQGDTYELEDGAMRITEVKAPSGYKVVDGKNKGAFVIKGKVINQASVTVRVTGGRTIYAGAEITADAFKQYEQKERYDFKLKKVDSYGNPMAGVAFLVTASNGDQHVVVTDKNGEFDSSKLDYTNVNGNDATLAKAMADTTLYPTYKETNVFFTTPGSGKTAAAEIKEETVDGKAPRPLYKDTYTIREIHRQYVTIDGKKYKLTQVYDLGPAQKITVSDSAKNGAVIDFGTYTNTAIPKMTSSAISTDTNTKMSVAGKNSSFKDSVKATNLKASTKYTLMSVAVDANTGKAYKDADGKYVAKNVEFTTGAVKKGTVFPETTASVTFTGVNTSNVKSRKLVFYEYLVEGSVTKTVSLDSAGKPVEPANCVAKDASVSNKAQTVNVISLETKVLVDSTKTNVAPADEKVDVTDTVTLHNLVAGTKFTLVGKVSDGENIKVENEVEFTAKGDDETVSVPLKGLNLTEYAGKSLYVICELKYDGEVIATHNEDGTDPDEKFYVPAVETNAITKLHVGYASKTAIFRDSVDYYNLIVGDWYSTTLTLHLNKNGKDAGPLKDANGNLITATVKFQAKTTDGSVKVEVKYDASLLAGETVTAFETIRTKGYEVCGHTEITDEGQQIHYPELKTSAKNSKDNSQHVKEGEVAKIVDTVNYSKLDSSVAYKVVTEAWDYNTQQIVVSDGKKVRKVTELHVDSKKPENGSFDVSMSFKTDGLGKHRIVIFEYVYDNKGNLISKEADFDAESQTIYIDKTPNKTGDRTVMFLSILAGMLGLGVVTLFVTKRKKK